MPAGGLRRGLLLAVLWALAGDALASDENGQRSLRRGEGKKAADRDEDSGSSGAHPQRALSAASPPTQRVRRRRDRARLLSGGGASSSQPAASCCWLFVEATKKYKYYVRPANAACAASYKLAQCPAGAAPAKPATSPAPAAAAPAAAVPAKTEPAPTPAPAKAVAATDAASVSGATAAAPESSGASVPSGDRHAGGGVHTGHQRISASPPPPDVAPSTSSSGGGSVSGGINGMLINAGVIAVIACALFLLRGRMMGALREFFPSGSTGEVTPAKDRKYKKVRGASAQEDDNASQGSNSCGLSGGEEEVDPIAEEWAARLAAQREGRTYVPAEKPSNTLACSKPTGCGAGPVPRFGGAAGPAGFQTPQPGGAGAAEEEGFGGFEEEAGPYGNDQYGQQTPQTAEQPGYGGRQPDWSVLQQPGYGGRGGAGPAMDIGDVSALEGLGQPKPPPRDDIDWGMLADPGGAKHDGDPFMMHGRDEEAGGGGGAEEEEDDEFTVFAGFDRDNKPTNKKGAAQTRGQADGAGLSWDAERKVWEKHNSSACARRRPRPNAIADASPSASSLTAVCLRVSRSWWRLWVSLLVWWQLGPARVELPLARLALAHPLAGGEGLQRFDVLVPLHEPVDAALQGADRLAL